MSSQQQQPVAVNATSTAAADTPFLLRTGDTMLFDRNCKMMQFPFGYLVCLGAKQRGTAYDHVGVVVVDREKKQQPNQEQQQREQQQPQKEGDAQLKINHVEKRENDRTRVVDAVFRGVVVRPVHDAVKRKYNTSLKVRSLLTESDDKHDDGNHKLMLDRMREKSDEANGVRYKRRLLHFIASVLPAFPDRRDANSVLSERMIRERLLQSLVNEQLDSEGSVFSAVATRRQMHLRKEIALLHRAYVARRTRLERSTWRILAGMNEAGTHDAGYFCSEVSIAVLQAGQVVDSFPPATCHSPTDFACNAQQSSSPANPHAVCNLSVDVKSCFAPPVEIKPTSPERGLDAALIAGKMKRQNLSSTERNELVPALARELKRRFDDESDASTAQFQPFQIEQGQIVWFGDDQANMPAVSAVFTGDVSCLLVSETASTTTTTTTRSRSIDSSQRAAPMMWLAHPPARSLFTSAQFQNLETKALLPSSSGRVGVLAKSSGVMWAATCSSGNFSPAPISNSTRTLSPGQSLFFRESSFSSSPAAAAAATSEEPADSVVYVVLAGSVQDSSFGRSFFCGDVIGAQELLSRTVGVFPRERMGGWENDVVRDMALLDRNETSRAAHHALELLDSPLTLKAGRAGAVVAAVSASEIIPSLVTSSDDSLVNVPPSLFRVVASVLAPSDPNCRMSISDANLLLYGASPHSSAPSDHLVEQLQSWLLFGGRVSPTTAQTSSDSRLVNFDDFMRAVDTLQQIVDGDEDNNALFVDIVLAPLLEALRCQRGDDAIPYGVAELNTALSEMLLGDDDNSSASFVDGSGLRDIDQLDLCENIVADLLAGKLPLGKRGTEVVAELRRLAKRAATVGAHDDSRSLMPSLLRNISGGDWSTRNAIIDAGSGHLVVEHETPSPVHVVLRLWLAVASGIAASSLFLHRELNSNSEWVRRQWFSSAAGSASSYSSPSSSLHDVGIKLNVKTFLVRACAARALIAVTIHSVLLFGALKWHERRELRRRTRNHHADSALAATAHPRWMYLRIAVLTGLVASLLTLPLESAMLAVANNKPARVFKLPRRSLFAWTLFTAAPYVGAVQWLYAHELLLPLGMLSPAVSPSFLFPQFDAVADAARWKSNSSTERFNWLSPGSFDTAKLRAVWVGLATTAMFAVVYPLEALRRGALLHQKTPSRFLSDAVKRDGVYCTMRSAYSGFSFSLRRMQLANIVSYTLFSASMHIAG